MNVLYAPEAVDDLRAVAEHLSERNPTAAARLVERVFEVIEQLRRGDFEGPTQVLRSGQAVQSWPVRPLRIYYQRSEGILHVLRIYHQARRPIVS